MKGRGREDRVAAGVAGMIAGCPPAEQLQAYHQGTLDRERRDETAAHMTGCHRCAAAIEYLESEPAEEETAVIPPDVERRTAELVDVVRRNAAGQSRRWWEGALRVAAVLAFGMALGLGAWQWLGPQRLDDDLGAYRGGEPLDLLEPVGVLPAPPATMRWELHPEARSYRVILLDEGMNMVWTRRNQQAEGRLTLDAEAMEALLPGSRYTWQVEALDAVGAVIDRSAAAHFEIAGATPR